ncbi:MAG TPA: hypothetical protein VN673_05890, partial [Clostridia bacterium]|nr:hypothetical protein [Clostridia bacterium]
MLITRLRWSALLLALFSSLLPASAAVFRVANLDLATASPRQETQQASLGTIAEHLRDLSPDIILVQGIRDWATCNELVRLLSPVEFRVVICSSFRQGKTQTEIIDQVAILTRHNGYFSWSEPWQTTTNTLIPGGFAFGAIGIGQTRLGCFSTMMPANLPRAAYEEAARK